MRSTPDTAQQHADAAANAAKSPHRVVVLISRDGADHASLPAIHNADQPLLLADDFAAVRGDGVFDALLFHRGRVLKVERHLKRIARSAAALQLECPETQRWQAGIDLAVQEWQRLHEGNAPDAIVRLVLTRGPEHRLGVAAAQTAYITVAATTAHIDAVRRNGIAVQTQARGFSVDLAATAPWQLLGAKTVSYATNMAALRHAAAQGFDDVLFLSAEAELLEGPRSTLVIVRDGELLSPPADIGILAGTTLDAVSELAAQRGIPVRREHLLVTDVLAADSSWFISSVTLAARFTRLDNHELSTGDPGIDVGALVAEAVGFQNWPHTAHNEADSWPY